MHPCNAGSFLVWQYSTRMQKGRTCKIKVEVQVEQMVALYIDICIYTHISMGSFSKGYKEGLLQKGPSRGIPAGSFSEGHLGLLSSTRFPSTTAQWELYRGLVVLMLYGSFNRERPNLMNKWLQVGNCRERSGVHKGYPTNMP